MGSLRTVRHPCRYRRVHFRLTLAFPLHYVLCRGRHDVRPALRVAMTPAMREYRTGRDLRPLLFDTVPVLTGGRQRFWHVRRRLAGAVVRPLFLALLLFSGIRGVAGSRGVVVAMLQRRRHVLLRVGRYRDSFALDHLQPGVGVAVTRPFSRSGAPGNRAVLVVHIHKLPVAVLVAGRRHAHRHPGQRRTVLGMRAILRVTRVVLGRLGRRRPPLEGIAGRLRVVSDGRGR